MEPDVYQRLLLTLLTIARSRPENLELIVPKDACRQTAVKADAGVAEVTSSSAEGHLSVEGFIALLCDMFWKLYSLKPKNLGVVPLISPG